MTAFRRRAIAAGLAAASLLPPAIAAAHIARHGRNVPFMDEWGHSVWLSAAASRGEATAAAVLVQQNAHYLVFHNLSTLALTWTTRWDLKAGMFAGLGWAVLAWLLALGLYGRARAWLALPFSLLVFSLRQRECWLWAQLDTYLFLSALAMGVLVLLLRSGGSWRALAAAGALCLFGAFSAASAVALWPTVLLALPALGYRGPRPRLAWAAGMLVTLGVFFANYRWLRSGVVADPLFLTRFVLTYLGSPVAAPGGAALWTAPLFATLALAVMAWNTVRWRAERSAPEEEGRVGATWALAAFAAGCGLLTGAGRGVHGIAQALESRYVTQASLFWIAAVGLAAIALRHGTRLQAAVNAALIAMAAAGAAYAGAAAAQAPPLVSAAQEACVRAWTDTRETACLAGLHPRPERLGPAIEALRAERLSLFADAPVDARTRP